MIIDFNWKEQRNKCYQLNSSETPVEKEEYFRYLGIISEYLTWSKLGVTNAVHHVPAGDHSRRLHGML